MARRWLGWCDGADGATASQSNGAVGCFNRTMLSSGATSLPGSYKRPKQPLRNMRLIMLPECGVLGRKKRVRGTTGQTRMRCGLDKHPKHLKHPKQSPQATPSRDPTWAFRPVDLRSSTDCCQGVRSSSICCGLVVSSNCRKMFDDGRGDTEKGSHPI